MLGSKINSYWSSRPGSDWRPPWPAARGRARPASWAAPRCLHSPAPRPPHPRAHCRCRWTNIFTPLLKYFLKSSKYFYLSATSVLARDLSRGSGGAMKLGFTRPRFLCKYKMKLTADGQSLRRFKTKATKRGSYPPTWVRRCRGWRPARWRPRCPQRGWSRPGAAPGARAGWSGTPDKGNKVTGSFDEIHSALHIKQILLY